MEYCMVANPNTTQDRSAKPSSKHREKKSAPTIAKNTEPGSPGNTKLSDIVKQAQKNSTDIFESLV